MNPKLWHLKHYNKQAGSSERAQQKSNYMTTLLCPERNKALLYHFLFFFNVLYGFYTTELQQKNNFS